MQVATVSDAMLVIEGLAVHWWLRYDEHHNQQVKARHTNLCHVSLQVATSSDVLFIFGGLAEVRDAIKEIKDDLKQQIVVPVTTDGNLDVFLVGPLCLLSYTSCCNSVVVCPNCMPFCHSLPLNMFSCWEAS